MRARSWRPGPHWGRASWRGSSSPDPARRGRGARNVPRGDTIACRVATDHLIVAGISNWGAWALGVGTVLACGLQPVIDVDLERRILSRMIAEGNLIDGVAGGPTLSVDGLPFDNY